MKKPKFKSGDRVNHRHWGIGTVVRHMSYGYYLVIMDVPHLVHLRRYYDPEGRTVIDLGENRVAEVNSRSMSLIIEDVGDLEDDI